MDRDRLTKVLDAHAAWLKGEGGKRANLTRANLDWTNLSGANLTRANLTRANLTRANLIGANLAGANLAGANLTLANLTLANLTLANLTGANLAVAHLTGAHLTGAIGIRWGQIGPVGQGQRLLTAWAHESLSEPVIAGGCFRGTFAEFRDTIGRGTPWDWGQGSDEDRDRWRTECSAAADLLELAVRAIVTSPSGSG